MHNNIMAAGSRDRPPMLVPGRYPQWRSRFLRYVDTKPSGEALRNCILSGPYKPTIVLVQAVEATNNSPAVPEHTTVETPTNMSPENKAHFLAEKEVIHLILTGIGDDIYSTGDACQTTQEIWEAIERLQQVNELRAEKLAMNANPLALVATAQADRDPYYRTSRTSSNSKNKNVDTAPRFKNDNQSGQFGNQRTVNVAAVRENVGSKEYGHFAKECRKLKSVKDFAYHKEKMLLCKQAEQGVPLQAEQYDWLADTDEEVDKQELEAHYIYMAKIQENEQNDVENDDERVALANLIANLKLDVDENKKTQKQLKKANTTLAQELKECKAILAESSKSLGESISVRDSCLVALQTK
nr:hypothetical protein [Tanacetum cinerariifolium]